MTLNGAIFSIPFIPYGPGFNQVIRISNSSGVSGSIELMAFNEDGEQVGPLVLSAMATANNVTSLSAAIREALGEELGEGFDDVGVGFDITLIVNALSEDVDMSANYRVNDDRVSVTIIKDKDNVNSIE